MTKKGLVKKLWETTYEHIVSRSANLYAGVQNSTETSFWSILSNKSSDDTVVNPEKNIDLNTDWAWKVFDLRSSDTAKHDWKLFHIANEKKKTEIESHVGIDLFYKVNAEYTEFDLWKYTFMSYDVFGEAFWVFDFDAFGVPVNITPIMRDQGRMEVRRNGYGEIIQYRLIPNAVQQPIVFEPYEIFYFRCFDLSSSVRGLGLMNKIMRLAQIDRGIKQRMMDSMDNYGSASMHMKVDRALNDKDFKDAKSRFQEEWRKSRNFRLPIFTDLGTTIEEFGQTVRELDFANSNNNIRDQVISLGGTPRYLFGFPGAVNKADVEGQKIAYLENTIHPLLDIRDQRMSQDFWNRFFQPKTGYLSMESCKALLDDKETELRQDKIKMGMGLYTIDEMLEKHGMKKVGGEVGNMRMMSSDMKPFERTKNETI